jgi:hypothetical protein
MKEAGFFRLFEQQTKNYAKKVSTALNLR